MRIAGAPVAEVAAPEVADSLPAEMPMQDMPNASLQSCDRPLA
jgi:hypothetical protein